MLKLERFEGHSKKIFVLKYAWKLGWFSRSNGNGPNHSRFGSIIDSFGAMIRNALVATGEKVSRSIEWCGESIICRAQGAPCLRVVFICIIHDTFHTHSHPSHSWFSDYTLGSLSCSLITHRSLHFIVKCDKSGMLVEHHQSGRVASRSRSQYSGKLPIESCGQ